MGYRLNRLDEPVFIAVSKPLLTEFDIHYRLESCEEGWKQADSSHFNEKFSLSYDTTVQYISR